MKKQQKFTFENHEYFDEYFARRFQNISLEVSYGNKLRAWNSIGRLLDITKKEAENNPLSPSLIKRVKSLDEYILKWAPTSQLIDDDEYDVGDSQEPNPLEYLHAKVQSILNGALTPEAWQDQWEKLKAKVRTHIDKERATGDRDLLLKVLGWAITKWKIYPPQNETEREERDAILEECNDLLARR